MRRSSSQVRPQCARSGCPYAHNKSERRHGFCCNSCSFNEAAHTRNCTGWGSSVVEVPSSSSRSVLPDWLNDQCSVCLETLWDNEDDKPVVALKCKHAFHYLCFARLRQGLCPSCRRKIDYSGESNDDDSSSLHSYSGGYLLSYDGGDLGYDGSGGAPLEPRWIQLDCCCSWWAGWYCWICGTQR